MLYFSKKISSIDDEIEQFDYRDLIVGREWYVRSGWFNENEIIFVLEKPKETSYDCFTFLKGNTVVHHTLKSINEDTFKLEKGTYNIEASKLSLSLTFLVSISMYEKTGSEKNLVTKVKRKALYDIDWDIIQINEKRLILKRNSVFISKEVLINSK